MYKKGPNSVHADGLSQLSTLAEATANDWDGIPPFFLIEQF